MFVISMIDAKCIVIVEKGKDYNVPFGESSLCLPTNQLETDALRNGDPATVVDYLAYRTWRMALCFNVAVIIASLMMGKIITNFANHTPGFAGFRFNIPTLKWFGRSINIGLRHRELGFKARYYVDQYLEKEGMNMSIFEYKYEDISDLVEQRCPHLVGIPSVPPAAERIESTPVEYVQSTASELEGATSLHRSSSPSGDISVREETCIRVGVQKPQLGSPFNEDSRGRSGPDQRSLWSPDEHGTQREPVRRMVVFSQPTTNSLQLAVQSPPTTSIPLTEISRTPSTCGSHSELLTPDEVALSQHGSVKFCQDEYE